MKSRIEQETGKRNYLLTSMTFKARQLSSSLPLGQYILLRLMRGREGTCEIGRGMAGKLLQRSASSLWAVPRSRIGMRGRHRERGLGSQGQRSRGVNTWRMRPSCGNLRSLRVAETILGWLERDRGVTGRGHKTCVRHFESSIQGSFWIYQGD